MEELSMESAGVVLGLAAAGLLCMAGLVLSCMSLSGTWLVTAGAIIAVLLRGDAFPGWGTVVVFAVLSVLVEVLEFIAGAWVVKRRGGSKLAGVAAVAGGMLGLIVGGLLVPVPVAGSLLGMLAGSFGLVFLVERGRLEEAAVSIAWGAVLGRVLMVVVKVCVTLGMTAWLFIGMASEWM